MKSHVGVQDNISIQFIRNTTTDMDTYLACLESMPLSVDEMRVRFLQVFPDKLEYFEAFIADLDQ